MIKDKMTILTKFVAFTTITLFFVHSVNNLLMPKYYYNEDWPTTNTYKDFYNLDKNTVDVLFLGSSHIVSAVNPQVIYDNYGITSYNLGCEQQSLVVSYYWLREALKYQSPKVVVLDTYTLHKYYDNYVYNDMNCGEGAVRKAMDSMRFSPLKWEAGKVIEEIDPSQDGLSYPLMNIRYHDRWKLLSKKDFIAPQMVSHGGVKGYTTLGGTSPGLEYIPFKAKDSASATPENMVDTAKIYLEKIVDICNKNDIQLVLISIPCYESIERYKSTNDFAQSNNIPFYDFNEESLYNAINYNASENLLHHLNYLGAEKVSNYLGEMLLNQYKICPREDSSFDKSRKVYEHKIENIELLNITNIDQYLKALDNDNYILFMWGPSTFSDFLADQTLTAFYNLGVTTDLHQLSQSSPSLYYAILDSNSTVEDISESDLNLSGTVNDGLVPYRFAVDTSCMMADGYTFSVQIAERECGSITDGLSIVVYDKDHAKIIDKILFNPAVDNRYFDRY